MQIKKAIEISDAKIKFVSLVDKAANKVELLIAKAENGQAQFTTRGKILKADVETHYITGIVYEPMVEDAHGNYMTEEEIKKAANWFMKNGGAVDIQHSFEPVDGICVVENYVAPCDMEIGGEPVVKGTWIMTVEVTNGEVWDAVQKGELTGLSMGGIGKYSEEDTDLAEVTKTETPAADETTEKKGLAKVLKGLASFLGFDVVEKGAMMDAYKEGMKSSCFWNAFYTLEDFLYRYNWRTDRWEFEGDETTVREALSDFSTIIADLLADTGQSITKALVAGAPVCKAGKKMSSANKEKLDAAYQALSELRDALTDEDAAETIEKEEINLNKTELQAMIDESVTKALAPLLKGLEGAAETPEGTQDNPSPVTVSKSAEEPLTKEAVQQIVEDTVAAGISKALEPFLKARGVASNLNSEKPVEKSEGHFLAGIL